MKQVVIDKKQANVREWADENIEHCTESVS